jgi:hypothetical protein
LEALRRTGLIVGILWFAAAFRDKERRRDEWHRSSRQRSSLLQSRRSLQRCFGLCLPKSGPRPRFVPSGQCATHSQPAKRRGSHQPVRVSLGGSSCFMAGITACRADRVRLSVPPQICRNSTRRADGPSAGCTPGTRYPSGHSARASTGSVGVQSPAHWQSGYGLRARTGQGFAACVDRK